MFDAAATGDVTILPHKGKQASPLRQVISRNPHSTGVKLYVLADTVHPFFTDVFLYAGPKATKFVGRSGVAGDNNFSTIVHWWVGLLPKGTSLVADSYFGSHDVALQLAHWQVLFLMLCKRDTELVPEMGPQPRPDRFRRGIV